MASSFAIIAGDIFGNGTTNCYPVANSGANGHTIEAESKIKYRFAGTAKNLHVNIISNGTLGTSTLVLRKNSTTDTALTISIGSGITGQLEDTTNTATFSVADDLSFKFVYASGGNISI